MATMEYESYEKETGRYSETFWKSAETGSMLGNGSLAMVISLAALATSIVSISLTISNNKKIPLPKRR